MAFIYGLVMVFQASLLEMCRVPRYWEYGAADITTVVVFCPKNEPK